MKAHPVRLRPGVLLYGLLAESAGVLGGLSTWVTLQALLGRVDPDLWPLALLIGLPGWGICPGLARLVRRDLQRLQ